MSWKTWVKIIAGYILLGIGAAAGIYQLELHPKTSDLLCNPFAGSNLLMLALPFITVLGMISGMLVVWKVLEAD
ncbi:MAG: hypothetical protein QW717_02995 [Candidatus Bathyarchaeia archaeon]